MHLAIKIILIFIFIIIIILVSTRLRTRFSLVGMGPVHPCLLPGGGEKPSLVLMSLTSSLVAVTRHRGERRFLTSDHVENTEPWKHPWKFQPPQQRWIPTGNTTEGRAGEPWRFSPNETMLLRSALSFWWALTRRPSTREMLFHWLFYLLLHQYKFLVFIFPFLFKQLLWKIVQHTRTHKE